MADMTLLFWFWFWFSCAEPAADRIGADLIAVETSTAPGAPEPTSSEVRAWARAAGISVPDRGRRRRSPRTGQGAPVWDRPTVRRGTWRTVGVGSDVGGGPLVGRV